MKEKHFATWKDKLWISADHQIRTCGASLVCGLHSKYCSTVVFGLPYTHVYLSKKSSRPIIFEKNATKWQIFVDRILKYIHFFGVKFELQTFEVYMLLV